MTTIHATPTQLRHQARTNHSTGHSAAAPLPIETAPPVPPTGLFGGNLVPLEGFGVALGAAVAAGATAQAPALFAKVGSARDAATTPAVLPAAAKAAPAAAPALPPVAKFAAAGVDTPAPAAGNAEGNWGTPPAAHAVAVNIGLARSADPRDAAVLLANLNGDQTAVNQMHNYYDVGGPGYKPWLNQLVTLKLDAPLPGAMAQQWAAEGLGTVAADGKWTWADGKGW